MSYAEKIEELIAERHALRQRVNDEQEKNIQLKLAALKARAKLTAERDMSDKLEKALAELVACKSMKDWGFGAHDTGSEDEYMRRKPIAWQSARSVLAELAAMRKRAAENEWLDQIDTTTKNTIKELKCFYESALDLLSFTQVNCIVENATRKAEKQ